LLFFSPAPSHLLFFCFSLPLGLCLNFRLFNPCHQSLHFLHVIHFSSLLFLFLKLNISFYFFNSPSQLLLLSIALYFLHLEPSLSAQLYTSFLRSEERR